MKLTALMFLTTAVALSLIGCGAPANNAPVVNTTNTNTAKAPSAPTANDLMALDKAANDAYFKGDSKFFETFLSDKFGGMSNGKHDTKADVVKFIGGVKCDMKGDISLTEPQMSKIDDDTYVFSYKGTFDGTCNDGPGGKTQKIPSPIRAATVFVRNADKWQAAWHSEMGIAEPKGDDKSANTKSDMKKDDAKKPEAKADDTKKDAEKPMEKKDEPKKDDMKKDDKTSTSSNSAANTATASEAPKADANTDALVKAELGGWTAWKDKDAAKLEAFAAKNLAFIEPDGMWQGSRAEIIKRWSNTSDCTGVTKVDIKNGFAWALSPTVEILMYDATADGMCNGMKNGPMWGTSVYVKEGSDWKEAFGFVQPAHHM